MTKPTKMRNRQIYKASQALRSKQVSANLSKGLRSKYGQRSIRVVEGDSVIIMRGEYGTITGKIEKVDVSSGRVSVSGIKDEKAKGDKFDVMIHPSNIKVTGLNLHDPMRRERIGATDEHEAEDVYDPDAAKGGVSYAHSAAGLGGVAGGQVSGSSPVVSRLPRRDEGLDGAGADDDMDDFDDDDDDLISESMLSDDADDKKSDDTEAASAASATEVSNHDASGQPDGAGAGGGAEGAKYDGDDDYDDDDDDDEWVQADKTEPDGQRGGS